MEYFILIALLLLILKILLCIFWKKLIYFTIFLMFNDLYLLFSCASQSDLNILFVFLYFIHELFSFLYIYILYNSKTKVDYICKDLHLCLRPSIYVLLFSIIVLIGIKNDFGLDFRNNYVKLIDANRSGSPEFTIIVLILLILNTYCIKLRFLIPTIIICIMLGSKGLLFGPLAVYFCYKYTIYGFNIKLLLFIFLCFGMVYLYLQNITTGFENFINYYIYYYFDYAGNILSIVNKLELLPKVEFIPPFINDYIPGFSRLFSVNKTDFYYEYFPSSINEGKAPGLLNYELFFRLGILLSIIYPLLNIAFFILYLRLSKLFNNYFYSRVFIFSNNLRLLFVISLFFAVKDFSKKFVVFLTKT